jgi:hypothetical protein
VKDFDQVFKTDATELLFTSLTSNTKQSFIVTTLDACGKETAPSNEIQLIVDCAAPIQPEITSAASNARGIKVSWAAVDGADQYAVYIKKGPTVTFNSFELRQVVTKTILGFTFNGLTPETEYAVAVSAINGCGEGQTNIAVISTKSNATETPPAKGGGGSSKHAHHSSKDYSGNSGHHTARVGDHNFLPLASRN